MQITYFAADFTDPALERRVRLLRRGGASINLVGFRRSAKPIAEIDGIPTIDLGQTFDGRLGNRLIQVLRWSFHARQWRAMIANSDALLARNLEMGTIAHAAKAWAKSDARLVYECLDIHAAQIGNRMVSKALRRWERHVLAHSAALLISSPAHLVNYFAQLDVQLPEVILAENKRVLPGLDIVRPTSLHERSPPWRIGWFGLLRCVESFEILLSLAQHYPDLVHVMIRGRPIREVQSLIDRHLPLPNMQFDGAYTQADLAELYGTCDFTWAIEFVGQNAENAKWALGNRLYEGSFYNSPVLALSGTAMGDWLQKRRSGVLVRNPRTELPHFISQLTTAVYRDLKQASMAIPTSDLVWTLDDCRRLAARISGVTLDHRRMAA